MQSTLLESNENPTVMILTTKIPAAVGIFLTSVSAVRRDAIRPCGQNPQECPSSAEKFIHEPLLCRAIAFPPNYLVIGDHAAAATAREGVAMAGSG